MEQDPNLDKLTAEWEEIREDLKDILMDIRVFLMEAQTPIPNDLEKTKLNQELQSERG
jgi:hypothetical protein